MANWKLKRFVLFIVANGGEGIKAGLPSFQFPLISLSLEKGIEELNPFSEKDQQKLRKIYTSFNLEDSKRVKAIEEATKNLNEVLTPLTQKLYPQAEESSSETSDENSSDENTVDAEFEEVKEEEK